MSGHHPEHIGLQKYSVGAIFPKVLVGFGDDTWGIRNEHGLYLTGPVSGKQRFPTVENALARLRSGPAPGVRGASYAQHDWEPLVSKAGASKPFRPSAAWPEPATHPAPVPQVSPGRWNWYDQLDEPEERQAAKMVAPPPAFELSLSTSELAAIQVALRQRIEKLRNLNPWGNVAINYPALVSAYQRVLNAR